MRLPSICLSILAMAISSSAMAHSESGFLKPLVQQTKSQCKDDIHKLCSGVKPGEGRIAACLKSKEGDLSKGCASARENLISKISDRLDRAEVAFRKSCSSDVQKFCSDTPSGQGRIIDCLTDHQNDLSGNCKNFQAKVEQKLEKALG